MVSFKKRTDERTFASVSGSVRLIKELNPVFSESDDAIVREIYLDDSTIKKGSFFLIAKWKIDSCPIKSDFSCNALYDRWLYKK